MVLLRERTRPGVGIIEPCLPSPAKAPPSSPGWIHEIKHDGFRIVRLGRHNFGPIKVFSSRDPLSFSAGKGRVMRTSAGPSSGAKSPPHVVVIGNHKGGSGKSTFAMHIIVALLKAKKRVACFDLDLNQLTLTRYLRNRHEWDRKHEQKLELPDHYPVTEEVHGSTLRRFISRLKKIGRAHKDDFIDSSALSHS